MWDRCGKCQKDRLVAMMARIFRGGWCRVRRYCETVELGRAPSHKKLMGERAQLQQAKHELRRMFCWFALKRTSTQQQRISGPC